MKLDHVHLPCRDRDTMADWLGRVFGLVPAPEFAMWDRDGGPRFLAGADGHALALFETEWDETKAADHTIAFSVGADAFVKLLQQADDLGLANRFGTPLSEAGPTDHDGLALSLYFLSPEGHRFEVTTYDVANAVVTLA